MDALGWSNAAVTALQWGTLVPLKDVPLGTARSPFPTRTPTLPQLLGWESQSNTLIQGETKSSPERSRDPLGPAPAAVGSLLLPYSHSKLLAFRSHPTPAPGEG